LQYDAVRIDGVTIYAKESVNMLDRISHWLNFVEVPEGTFFMGADPTDLYVGGEECPSRPARFV
jgi:hypothetical protein